jgi:ribosomal protein S18 acetylase RimI-like enzyme
VGVLALEHRGDESELRNFAVDGRSQRRGVGRAAIEALIRHVRATRPASTTLLVSAHPENERALRLYQRSGFEPTGTYKGIEPVLALRLDG